MTSECKAPESGPLLNRKVWMILETMGWMCPSKEDGRRRAWSLSRGSRMIRTHGKGRRRGTSE